MCWLPFDVATQHLLSHMHLQHSDSALNSGKAFSIIFLPTSCVLFALGECLYLHCQLQCQSAFPMCTFSRKLMVPCLSDTFSPTFWLLIFASFPCECPVPWLWLASLWHQVIISVFVILFMLHCFCARVSVLFLSWTMGSGLELLRSQPPNTSPRTRYLDNNNILE